jgi:AcrR family transcriptional regulator
LRAEAIAVALERIRIDGAPVFSLREIATAVGVSHGALYRHFSDRNALLAAVAVGGFTALYEAHQAALARAGEGARDRLVAICHAHFGFALARPADWWWVGRVGRTG